MTQTVHCIRPFFINTDCYSLCFLIAYYNLSDADVQNELLGFRQTSMSNLILGAEIEHVFCFLSERKELIGFPHLFQAFRMET